ncbi:DsbA family protein [Bradyrhizobium diazoefficiens]|jgi:protein-disulfide isomerase|nr:DsbA family protein [Bradyrhizobium diazoefficiens]MBR0702695.1 DsbA family protein [Bradyrhizobium diazoefficiens]MBR0771450.1 DsbA family protein [Bradyrhizobium diazoefficiens]
MTPLRHLLPAFLAISAISFVGSATAETQRSEIEPVVREYLASHPEDVQAIVKDYLLKNPEILRDALGELIKKQAAAKPARIAPDSAEQKAAIRSNAQALFDSAHQVVLGNPRGNVTLVEYFDYNCGYCRRALADMLSLLQGDGNLRVVLKEFPVLGPTSVEAAGVSIAVRIQDPTGEKYLAFHRRLLGSNGRVDKATALAAARDVGLDMARLEQDLSSDEVRQTLEEGRTLAKALGISGTPSYVIGDAIIPGAMGAAGLKEKIALARSR